MEESFTAKTNFGNFKVIIKPDITFDMQTREKIQVGYSIQVGGNIHTCVYLKIPLSGKEGYFTRLDSKEGCSLDPPYTVGGEKTVGMVKLAMTVAKEKQSELEILKLQDSASFPCLLPNDKYYQVNSTDYDLFFYQQSYYEKRYGAILINPDLRRLYEDKKKHFTDPTKKPSEFDFLETKLHEQMTPLYQTSSTWKEFADKLSNIWKEKKCTAVYLWLKTALSKIFDSVSFAGQDWYIVLNSEHIISYKKIQNGGRQTRKQRRIKTIDIHQYPSPEEYLKMNWYMRSNHRLGDGHQILGS